MQKMYRFQPVISTSTERPKSGGGFLAPLQGIARMVRPVLALLALIVAVPQAAWSFTPGTLNVPTSGLFTTISNAQTPISATGGGFTFTNVTSFKGSLNNPSLNRINYLCSSTSPDTSYVQTGYVGFKSDDGTAFKLMTINMVAATLQWATPNTLTMTGYKAGSVVSGATATKSDFALDTGTTQYTWDVSAVTGFGNVDEIRISTNYNSGVAGGQSGGRLSLYQIVTQTAVTPAVAPTVTTSTSASITSTTATLGGNATNDGGAAITERGVVYSLTATNSNPILNGTGVLKATTSGTTGVFTVPVSTLSAASGYSYKAYATNSVGTSYSPVSTFTTLPLPPTVTGVSPSSGPTTGGTVATITGTNLTGATGVTIGGTAVTSFYVNNATTITAVIPAGTVGAKSVVVTTSGGANSANSLYTYNTAVTSTVVDFEPSSSGGSGVPSGLTFPSGGKTWSFNGFIVDGSSAGLGSAPVGSATAASDHYLDTGFLSARSTGSVGSIVAPTGTTFRAVGIDIWPSSDQGNDIIPYPGGGNNGSNLPGETGHTFTVKGYKSGVVVVNVNVIDTLRTPPQSGSIAGGYWHHLEFTNSAFDTTDIDKLEIYLNTQSGTAFDGPNSGSALTTPNYIALDNFVYSTLTATTPTVTGISPTSGPAAGGTTVVITGTNLSSATGVKFGTTSATGLTANTATSITATAPAGTGTVDVTVTTASGTSATSVADQFTYIPAPTITSINTTSGPTAGGTTVIITGTNLSSATGVKFGTNSATGLTANTATSITVTAPAGSAGTVDVTLTTAGGTSATSAADQFTYVAAPTVTSLATTSGPTAGGTTVIITGTNLSSATGVKFGAASATGLTANTATSITVTAPAGSAGTVDVTVTTVGGTSATSAADQFTYVAAPTVASVSSTKANGSYNAAVLVPITVTFSAPVTVTGTPTLALNSGGSASYTSGSGTSTLTFNYTVGATDNATVLDCTSTSSLALAGGTISATTGGTTANLTLPTPGGANSLGVNKSIVIDTTAPTITSINRLTPSGQTAASNTVTFRVTYSEPVTVPGASNFSVVAVNGSNIVGTVTGVTGTGNTRDVTVTITSGTGEFRLRGVN